MTRLISLGETTRRYSSWPTKPLLLVRGPVEYKRALLWLLPPTDEYVMMRISSGVVLENDTRQFDYLIPVERVAGEFVLKDPPTENSGTVDFYIPGDILDVRAARARVDFSCPSGGPSGAGATGFISFTNFVWLHPIIPDVTRG
jgi:hypothetical protein